MRICLIPVSTLAASSLLGCLGSQQGQLYDLQAGRASNVVAMNPRSAAGVLEGSLPNGDACKGTFSEVSNEVAKQLNVADLPLSENAEVTMAVLDCGDHEVLECSLTRRPFYGFSFGACKDHHGEEYSLLF
jgi:hypothetical protein